jgi:DNA polymerase I-like protein with 3'-5' exonuclease and polymerase domains
MPQDFKYQTLLFDVETNGLLKQLDRVHCLAIKEYETGRIWRFRRNDKVNDINLGVKMLMQAKTVVGHNIVAFDIPAIKKIYPWFQVKGKIRDTLVMARVCFSDIKDMDFRMVKAGKMPAYMVGKHNLDAWGMRVGLYKGDYKKQCISNGIDPWAFWNQDMDDYCLNDVEVTALLWRKILQDKTKLNPFWIGIEHRIHDLCAYMEENGVYVHVDEAERLVEQLGQEDEALNQQCVLEFGKWYAPDKKWQVASKWDSPLAKAKKYKAPREEYGEDNSRAIWGDVVLPKRSINYKDPLRADRTEGAPFCPIKLKEFNPNSRDQIIDRFDMIFQWEPDEYTDTGRPTVDDEVLRSLKEDIPIADDLAELFYLKKRLGMLKTGKSSILNRVEPDGFIHCHINVGGTVSGRCSHINPNLSQITKVKTKKIDGKSVILKGRDGRHGWEFRNLFGVPPVEAGLGEWLQHGADLEGIELRCLAHASYKYDNGFLAELILEGDIHTYNQNMWEMELRDDAKTGIYALIYGGGDPKLGLIKLKRGTLAEKKAAGAWMRAQLDTKLPGLAKATNEAKSEARRGKMVGFDGRILLPRSQHSALNLKLQNMAAVIAKLWLVKYEEKMIEAGYRHGWDGDFVMMLFSHDEKQVAIRPELRDISKAISTEAATEAGKELGFMLPVDSDHKFGYRWSETH